MAEIKIPIKIDGFECVEDMAQAVLNYTYKGKTLKEWADSISKPQTNADRIRAMTDDEIKEWFCCERWCGNCRFLTVRGCTLIKWLKQKVEER